MTHKGRPYHQSKETNMLRMLGWATFIGGILLLAGAGAWWIFPGEDPPQYFLMSSADGPLQGNYALGVVGESNLTPIEVGVGNIRFQGWSMDTQSLYFVEENPVGSSARLIRWSLPDQEAQIIDTVARVHATENIYWTSNRHWMVYFQQDPTTGDYHLVRRRYDGSDPLNLTTGRGVAVVSAGAIPIAHSPDNEWLYFHGLAGQLSKMDIFRVRLTGGAVEQVTSDPRTTVTIVYIPAGGTWMMLRSTGYPPAGYYRLSVNHRHSRWIGSERTVQWDVLGWLPHQEQLVLFDPQGRQLVGWHGSHTGSPVWAVPEGQYLGATSDGKWVGVEGFGHQLMAVDPTSGATVLLTPRGTNGAVWGWAPDNRWLWFTYSETAGAPFEIRRVNLRGQVETLASFSTLPRFIEWAATSVKFSADGTPAAVPTVFQMALDGRDLAPYVTLSAEYPYWHRFAPSQDVNWNGRGLAQGGLLLIGTSLVGVYLKRKVWPSFEIIRHTWWVL